MPLSVVGFMTSFASFYEKDPGVDIIHASSQTSADVKKLAGGMKVLGNATKMVNFMKDWFMKECIFVNPKLNPEQST